MMTNKVSFIIQFKDKFSRTSAAIRRQFKGIKKGADAASRGIRKISSALKAVSFANLERGAKRATARLKELGKRGENLRKIGKGIATAGVASTAAVTLPAALIGKSLVDAASDATETKNKFNTVFESIKSKANEVASEYAKSFGVATSTSQRLLGSTGDLLVGLGQSESAALSTSKRIIELAADLASFQNLEGGTADAADRLTKALTGETESLKMLGIIIRQDTPEFKKLVKQTMRTDRVSIQLAKSTVILNESIRQSKKSIGDVSRTWDDYANLTRRVSERNIELKETYGQHLIPLATMMVKAYEKLVDIFINLSPATQKFILAVAGITAVLGPLLLIIGGLVIAFSFISLPILAITAAIAGLVLAGAFLIANWKKVTQFMRDSMNLAAAGAIIAIVLIIKTWREFKASVMGVIDDIKVAFADLWDSSFITSIKNAVSKGLDLLKPLLTPLAAVSDLIGFGDVNVASVAANDAGAPSAPVVAANGTLDGQITVAAAPGSEVKSTKLINRSSGLNVGMNMRAL
jgi:hypothetical protein